MSQNGLLLVGFQTKIFVRTPIFMHTYMHVVYNNLITVTAG